MVAFLACGSGPGCVPCVQPSWALPGRATLHRCDRSRENAKMEMTGEMMDSAIEDALDGDGAEEEADDVMAQARPSACPRSHRRSSAWHARATSRVAPASGLPRSDAPLCLRDCPQVLEEIGIDVAAQMGAAPTKRVPAQRQQQQQQEPDESDDLASRLAALK